MKILQTKLPLMACATVFGALALNFNAANAAVVTDATIVLGAGSIDPAGARTITTTATGSTAKNTLEALSGFGAVRYFRDSSSNTFAGSGATNYLSFTNIAVPDIQFTLSGNNANQASVGAGGIFHYGTSRFGSNLAGEFIFLQNGFSVSASSYTYTIDFGNWNGTTFDSAVNSVAASGFTLTGVSPQSTVSTVFFNGAGGTLSTQTAAGGTHTPTFGPDTGLDIYFGFSVANPTLSNSIGSIAITISQASASSNDLMGFDDIGFTAVVPEPSTLLLGAFAGLLALIARLRRRTA